MAGTAAKALAMSCRMEALYSPTRAATTRATSEGCGNQHNHKP